MLGAVFADAGAKKQPCFLEILRRNVAIVKAIVAKPAKKHKAFLPACIAHILFAKGQERCWINDLWRCFCRKMLIDAAQKF